LPAFIPNYLLSFIAAEKNILANPRHNNISSINWVVEMPEPLRVKKMVLNSNQL
jgi:hypothetical protein